MSKIDLNIEQTSIKISLPSSSSPTPPSSITINTPVSWLTKCSRDVRYIHLIHGVYVLSFTGYGYGQPTIIYLDSNNKYHVFDKQSTNFTGSGDSLYKENQYRLFIINTDMDISFTMDYRYNGGTMTFLRL